MKEGWSSTKYWIIFENEEIIELTRRYDIAKYLKGYRILGLVGWDDFILEDKNNNHYTVPTIPINRKFLEPIDYSSSLRLEDDVNLRGKIKWYIKPLIFSGDPNAKDNIIWINMDEHIKLIKWWNDRYVENAK
jgi:hypothetical protein